MSRLLVPQPPPQKGTAEPSWDGVLRVMETRSRQAYGPEAHAVWALLSSEAKQRDNEGARKYGVRHQHDNGRDHAVDAYQEAMDGCCYWWAEWEKTASVEALQLFGKALELAFAIRVYLYRRDGK